ncbi:MAG: DUF3617 family protein, partial [Allosphingosinicella sp.]
SSAFNLQPGEWEMKSEVINVEGVPPGIAMAARMQGVGTSRLCVTADEARRPVPDMFVRNPSGSCKSEGASAGGRIRRKTVCRAGGDIALSMEGQYTLRTVDVTIKSEINARGRQVTETRFTGRLVGDCTDAKKS